VKAQYLRRRMGNRYYVGFNGRFSRLEMFKDSDFNDTLDKWKIKVLVK
jgi:hypothetical protein